MRCSPFGRPGVEKERQSGLRGVGAGSGGRPCGRMKKIEIGIEAETAVAFLAGGFLDDVHLLETGEDFISLGEGDTELVFDLVGGNCGLCKEIVEKRVRAGHATEGIGDLLVSAFAEVDDFAGGGGSIMGNRGDAPEEEFDPALPVAGAADGSKAVIVFHAVKFEVVGEIEEGIFEDVAMAQ